MTNIQNPRAKTQKGFTPHLLRGKKEKVCLPFTFLKQKGEGFTLIEFLIIISIIGILAAISVLALKKYQPNLQLNGATRNLVVDLRYAQQLAVTEQLEYCVRFFPGDKEYRIIQCQNPDAEEVLKTISLQEIDSIEVIDFSNNEARYNPYGAVKKDGNITLEVNGKIKTIKVRPSGFVKITD